MPPSKTLKAQIDFALQQQKQDHDKFMRTQQLLLDFIWDQGFTAVYIDEFNAYRFIRNGDRAAISNLRDSLVSHRQDI